MAPDSVQLSSEPLSGSFVVECYNLDGTMATSAEIPWNYGAWKVRHEINRACPSLSDLVNVWDGRAYEYMQNGRDIYIEFEGINQDMT
mmetsp:Transcript_22257/g.16714  ORF Transcript_22257/g.16714 Transcript_22257/m.16714 type:complete len:88 (-) Transcript_22257:397-660(-)